MDWFLLVSDPPPPPANRWDQTEHISSKVHPLQQSGVDIHLNKEESMCGSHDRVTQGLVTQSVLPGPPNYHHVITCYNQSFSPYSRSTES